MNNEVKIRLTLTVFDAHDLRVELLSYGPAVEVLAPAQLRAWVRQQHGEVPLVPQLRRPGLISRAVLATGVAGVPL